MILAITSHWPEYLIEGALLGAFMISACVSVALLEHPASRVRRGIPSAFARRAIIGLLMGLTAVALIYSGPGQRSGAHMNPAVTLAFLTLGKVHPWDAMFYVFAQALGGMAGVFLARAALGAAVGHPSVNFAVTGPGPAGARIAWVAEFVIAFGMMTMVLVSTDTPGAAPYTGLFAGALVAVYIAVEAPLSGMSMNPARSLASAVPARSYRALWVYLTAPPLAMLAAAGAFTAAHRSVPCAKLIHPDGPCIFCGAEEPQRAAARGIEPGRRSGAPDEGSR